MSGVSGHARRVNRPEEEEEEDLVDKELNRMGCSELHYKVQECMVENKDWRMCQTQVKAFKKCFEKSQKREEFP